MCFTHVGRATVRYRRGQLLVRIHKATDTICQIPRHIIMSFDIRSRRPMMSRKNANRVSENQNLSVFGLFRDLICRPRIRLHGGARVEGDGKATDRPIEDGWGTIRGSFETKRDIMDNSNPYLGGIPRR